ncbi:uncharacterized protein M421DRAFT_295328 [Didymella exigua CBS 183.55]|uniref:Uncharacterized protein n=1 Tax=Didymella exigua CBS 183.55 TaxID=1150837 RepID=A0A6A5R804_9PLEO|nr:uncharacterized protein M421DRAFT_295328 [Didymella exigua CBS 183.55]KAF1924315.1 hypothetical protein M421DRAFT_295328 [Didymella exigua CBS 183.55]
MPKRSLSILADKTLFIKMDSMRYLKCLANSAPGSEAIFCQVYRLPSWIRRCYGIRRATWSVAQTDEATSYLLPGVGLAGRAKWTIDPDQPYRGSSGRFLTRLPRHTVLRTTYDDQLATIVQTGSSRIGQNLKITSACGMVLASYTTVLGSSDRTLQTCSFIQ